MRKGPLCNPVGCIRQTRGLEATGVTRCHSGCLDPRKTGGVVS
jgi:hypothetical protein